MAKVSFLRFVDKYLGNFLIGIISLFRKRKKSFGKSKKVLIVRLWTLGESLLTLPLIEHLKENGFDVTVLVTKRSRAVFENKGYKILGFEHIANYLHLFKGFDIVIDTEPYLRVSSLLSWFFGKVSIGFDGLFRARIYDFKVNYNDKEHAVINFTRLLQPLNLFFIPEALVPLNYAKKDVTQVNKLLNDFNLNDKKLIGIHAGTAETAPWRSWKTQNFVKLIELLIKDGFYVVLTGSKSEYENNLKIINLLSEKSKVFNFAGKTTLSQLAFLMTRFGVFVSNDTGPMHLSAAMNVKTIGLFGPNLPSRFGPYGRKNVAIYKAKDLSCSPCINVHKGKFKKCKLNGKCMDLITVKDVYDTVVSLVGK